MMFEKFTHSPHRFSPMFAPGARRPTPTAESLAHLEAVCGPLPADYRAWLLEVGGGEFVIHREPPEREALVFVDSPQGVHRAVMDPGHVSVERGVRVGGDGGGILVFFDAENRLGKGAWSVWYEAMSEREPHYAAASLEAMFERIAAGWSFSDRFSDRE